VQEVKLSMGNPWGVVTRCYAWGANANGQLGNDELADCSSPQRYGESFDLVMYTTAMPIDGEGS
jgi:alpha-tubulin suppressor-like RCC1 family protein